MDNGMQSVHTCDMRKTRQQWPTLREALRAEMARRGVNQTEAAALIGCTVDNLGKWLAGALAEDPRFYDGLMEFLRTDLAGLGAMDLMTKIRRAEAKSL